MANEPIVFERSRKRTAQGGPDAFCILPQKDTGIGKGSAVSPGTGIGSSSGAGDGSGSGGLRMPEGTPPPLVFLKPEDRSAYEDSYQQQFGHVPPSEFEFQTWLKHLLRR
jgi:hypothetical protein